MSQATQSGDFHALIDALDSEIDELSRHCYEVFANAVSEARTWNATQQENFVQQARGRFGAILAVTSQGSQVDDALRRDLEEVGSGAAWAGSSLIHLQLVLRISRDLLIGRAMKLASQREGEWNTILASFAARVLPAIDRLIDSIAHGYWSALIQRHTEAHDRLSALVERIPYGVYEADLDGLLHYVNPAFAGIVGRPPAELQGVALGDALHASGDNNAVASMLAEPDGDAGQVAFEIQGPDGNPVSLDVDTVVRRVDGKVAGFAGIVRIHTAASLPDLSPLARHTDELRRTLPILGESGSFLERHAHEMDVAQLTQVGESVKRQTDRLIQVVEELDADRNALKPREA